MMAQEIDTSKGGVYSLLSHELQLPLVKRIQAGLEKEGKLPKLPEGTVEPVIITGYEALGRGNDANKLATFIQTLTQTLGPEVVSQYINVSDFAKRIGVGFGIDMKGLVKTQEEVQQEQQAQQQAQQQAEMMKAGVPNAVTQGGEMMRAQQQQGAQQQDGQ
jgi:pyruvoyl-dependent arginine decarboxylase (PvlArgDC)